MNSFIARWATALSAVAAATVLTAGAVRAVDPAPTTPEATVDASPTVQFAHLQTSLLPGPGCLPVTVDVEPDIDGLDVGSNPASADQAPASEQEGPAVASPSDVGVGTDVDPVPELGSLPPVPGGNDGSPTDGNPTDPDSGNADTGGPTDAGAGTPGTSVPPVGSLGTMQLADIDAAVEPTGVALDVAASDGQLIGLGVSDPPARNDDTRALITVDADASDIGPGNLGGPPSSNTDVDVADPPTPSVGAPAPIAQGQSAGLISIENVANGATVEPGPITSSAPLVVAPVSAAADALVG
jgi:hypothetical protein